MDIAQDITVAVTLLVLIGVLAYLIYALSQISEDVARSRRMRLLEEDIIASVASKPPTWEQLKVIATSRIVLPGEVTTVVANLFRDALTGRKDQVREHVALFEGYLAKASEEEPFLDIPDNLRPHLGRILAKLGDDSALIQPLVDELRELFAVNGRDRRRQRLVAAGGLVVGIVGVAIGIVALIATLYPPVWTCRPNNNAMQRAAPRAADTER